MDFTISKPEFSSVSTGKLTKVVEITSKTKENAVTRATALLWESYRRTVKGKTEWISLPIPTRIVANGQNAEILLELAKCKSSTVCAMGFNAPLTGTTDGRIEPGEFGLEATRQELVVQQLHILSFKPVEGEGEQSADQALADAAAQAEPSTDDTTTEAPTEKPAAAKRSKAKPAA